MDSTFRLGMPREKSDSKQKVLLWSYNSSSQNVYPAGIYVGFLVVLHLDDYNVSLDEHVLILYVVLTPMVLSLYTESGQIAHEASADGSSCGPLCQHAAAAAMVRNHSGASVWMS